MAQDEKSQRQLNKFRDLARELGCDEDEAKFDEALKRVATAPKAPVKSSETESPKTGKKKGDG